MFEKIKNAISNIKAELQGHIWWYACGAIAVFMVFSVSSKLVHNQVEINEKFVIVTQTQDQQDSESHAKYLKASSEKTALEMDNFKKAPIIFLSYGVIALLLTIISSTLTLYAYTKFPFLQKLNDGDAEALGHSVNIYRDHLKFWAAVVLVFLWKYYN
ncbi:MAG: hypothetical protein NT007_09625 [Candidatus Kapabacteria bacterium]|nr:hypothetical protein [Candidatus Kapabacteria bacterium]